MGPPRGPSTDEGEKEVPYTVVMEFYLVVKKNEIMTYAENEWQ